MSDSEILRLASEITEINSLISAEESSLSDIEINGDYSTRQFRKVETQRRISTLVDELDRLDRMLVYLQQRNLHILKFYINQQNLQLQNRNWQPAGKNYFELRASVFISRTSTYLSWCSQRCPRHVRGGFFQGSFQSTAGQRQRHYLRSRPRDLLGYASHSDGCKKFPAFSASERIP